MTEAMIDALRCMLTGMCGIFAVTIIIIVCIKLLNFFTKEKAPKQDEEKQAQ